MPARIEAALAPAISQKVEAFLREEARLLDAGEFDGWLDLFEPDGVYWIPALPGQTDPKNHPSIIHEDVALLRMRIARLNNPRAYAAHPLPRTMHLFGNLDIQQGEEHSIVARTALLVAEYREPNRRTFAGHCEHVLRPRGDTYSIKSKRYALIDCDGVHDVITVPM